MVSKILSSFVFIIGLYIIPVANSTEQPSFHITPEQSISDLLKMAKKPQLEPKDFQDAQYVMSQIDFLTSHEQSNNALRALHTMYHSQSFPTKEKKVLAVMSLYKGIPLFLPSHPNPEITGEQHKILHDILQKIPENRLKALINQTWN